MKFNFLAYCCKSWQQINNFLVLKPDQIYQKNLNIFLDKLEKAQLKKNELKELSITIEYHYQKRTLDQNALMWWLYHVLEAETGTNAEQLYKSDILEYADRTEIKIKSEYYDYYKSQYRFIEIEKPIAENEKITHYYMKLIESSSHMNTVQMAKWCNMLIIRLAEIGISDEHQAAIFNKLNQWQNFLNDQKIILYSDTTEDQYRKMHPLCEACFTWIKTGGELAHIKSKGAGGSDQMFNRLHLCNNCHIQTQHKKGWGHFTKLFPHLEYKINKALKG